MGAIMKRRSRSYSDEMLEVKIDWIEGLDRSFTQIQGKVRAAVEEAGTKLGLDGSYVPHSYIEQVQLEEMTEELRNLTEEMKDKFVMAANRSSMDIPHMERSGSGFGLGAIRSRLERAGRSESVTRLQDAVRKRRSERADGTGSGQWGSQGEVFADAAAQAAGLPRRWHVIQPHGIRIGCVQPDQRHARCSKLMRLDEGCEVFQADEA